MQAIEYVRQGLNSALAISKVVHDWRAAMAAQKSLGKLRAVAVETLIELEDQAAIGGSVTHWVDQIYALKAGDEPKTLPGESSNSRYVGVLFNLRPDFTTGEVWEYCLDAAERIPEGYHAEHNGKVIASSINRAWMWLY